MCYLGRCWGGVKSSTEVEILPQHRRVITKVVGERGRREKQEASYGGSSMLAARAEGGTTEQPDKGSHGEHRGANAIYILLFLIFFASVVV